MDHEYESEILKVESYVRAVPFAELESYLKSARATVNDCAKKNQDDVIYSYSLVGRVTVAELGEFYAEVVAVCENELDNRRFNALIGKRYSLLSELKSFFFK